MEWSVPVRLRHRSDHKRARPKRWRRRIELPPSSSQKQNARFHPRYRYVLPDFKDALGNAGCTDASIRGHIDGMELLFERDADSLQAAISSAIADIERAGYRVSKIELDREAISGITPAGYDA